jgi:hypothetical protein
MNKHISKIILSSLFISGTLFAGESSNLVATLADTEWSGNKIPEGQQCQKFKGHGSTPRIRVNNIPKGTNAIVVEYSDKTYKAMDNGGHGKIGYFIDERMEEVTIPPIQGHSFELPKSFFIVAPQQAPKWDKAGAYLPPCSGGKGNKYVATIKAVHLVNGKVDKLISEVDINIGVY